MFLFSLAVKANPLVNTHVWQNPTVMSQRVLVHHHTPSHTFVHPSNCLLLNTETTIKHLFNIILLPSY